MSRVHDALRRAETPKPAEESAAPGSAETPVVEQLTAPLGEETLAASTPVVEPAEPLSASPEVLAAWPVAEEPPVAPPQPVPVPTAVVSAPPAAPEEPPVAAVPAQPPVLRRTPPLDVPPPAGIETTATRRSSMLPGLFGRVDVVPFNPSVDASLLDPFRPTEGPIEEFRGIRTRLNHLQSQRTVKTIIVTSPSPAEGKSFTAANLAIAQAQLEGNYVLLADFDFRRPSIHHLFQIDRSPGLTEYLQGKALLEQTIKRIEGTNLFILPAGEVVTNPLELLNLPEAKRLIDYLGSLFRWVMIDTPPLLFAADANLLSTLCDGVLMVVRVGATTVETVTRAMQSLCQNNILGIIVNGARRGELYSKFTYYHSYYYTQKD